MIDLNDILNLGADGSNILSEQFNLDKLNYLLTELNELDVSNNRAFDMLVADKDLSNSTAELNMVWQTKERLSKLKEIIMQARTNIEKDEIRRTNQLVLFDCSNTDENEKIVIEEHHLKSVQKEILLENNLDGDSQFSYKHPQLRMNVTNKISFKLDMFETMAPIPLRLKYHNK